MLTLFLSKNLFHERIFIIIYMLKNKNKNKTFILLNIDNSEHAFIDKKLTQKQCEKLFISFQKLIKIKFIQKYDKKTKVAIMHVIDFIMIVNKHRKIFTSLLITKLKSYKLMLNKS